MLLQSEAPRPRRGCTVCEETCVTGRTQEAVWGVLTLGPVSVLFQSFEILGCSETVQGRLRIEDSVIHLEGEGPRGQGRRSWRWRESVPLLS